MINLEHTKDYGNYYKLNEANLCVFWTEFNDIFYENYRIADIYLLNLCLKSISRTKQNIWIQFLGCNYILTLICTSKL